MNENERSAGQATGAAASLRRGFLGTAAAGLTCAMSLGLPSTAGAQASGRPARKPQESAEWQERMLRLVYDLMAAKKAHDVAGLLRIYHPDVVLEQPSLGVRNQGRAALRPSLELFAKVFPDYERDFEGSAFDGNTLVSWGTARVTLTGEFDGHKPNGALAAVMTFIVYRFADDRIVYEGHHWDLASICHQSGIPVEAVKPMKRQA
jgi:predicted ester cyclase